MKRSAFFAIILSALLGSVSAYADTQQQITLSFPASTTTTGSDDLYAPSSPFAQFNPDLGTLNSVTFSAEGSFSGGGVVEFSVGNEFGPIGHDFFTVGDGSFDKTATVASDLLTGLTGTGDAIIAGFYVDIPNGTYTLDITSAELTYNYTPAVTSSTPEPSSLALLATGLLAVAGAARRRLGSRVVRC